MEKLLYREGPVKRLVRIALETSLVGSMVVLAPILFFNLAQPRNWTWGDAPINLVLALVGLSCVAAALFQIVSWLVPERIAEGAIEELSHQEGQDRVEAR